MSVLTILSIGHPALREVALDVPAEDVASDTVQSLIDDLTLEYNKLRQGNITKELLEIAGGQAG